MPNDLCTFSKSRPAVGERAPSAHTMPSGLACAYLRSSAWIIVFTLTLWRAMAFNAASGSALSAAHVLAIATASLVRLSSQIELLQVAHRHSGELCGIQLHLFLWAFPAICDIGVWTYFPLIAMNFSYLSVAQGVTCETLAHPLAVTGPLTLVKMISTGE